MFGSNDCEMSSRLNLEAVKFSNEKALTNLNPYIVQRHQACARCYRYMRKAHGPLVLLAQHTYLMPAF